MDWSPRLHERALRQFGQEVHQVPGERWGSPTPCSEWTVRDLVAHLVDEQHWAVPLLAGRALGEAGAEVPGDPLGTDPVRAWDAAATAVRTAIGDPSLPERTVHLSYGDSGASHYVAEMCTDLVVHGWDLARGAGLDETIDPELLGFAWGQIHGQAAELAASGVFGEPIPVPRDADIQTRLLGALGRRA